MIRKKCRIYFAYGIDLNLAQMKRKCSRPRVIGIARLPGYRINFYGYSHIWDGAVEAVIPDPAAEVWGVLYELEFADAYELDDYQGARLDGAGVYFHFPVQVIHEQNVQVDALIYKKSICGEEKKPSREYLQAIVDGACEQGLPAEYLNILQGIETKTASYRVPQYRPENPGGACGHECRECMS